MGRELVDAKPVLLITCSAGNEDWCEDEIGNVLFRYDPGVLIKKSRYPGLLIVYSELDVDKAYKYAYSVEYGFVKNIIPIHYYGLFSEDALTNILNLVSENERVKIKLRVRGVRGLSGILWNKLINILRTKNAVHDPGSKTCLYIEIIDNMMYLGKGLCRL